MQISITVNGTAATADVEPRFLETALAPDELLTEIRVPKAGGAGWSFQKIARRSADWAIVGVALVRGERTGVGLVNMGATPLQAAAVEAAVDRVHPLTRPRRFGAGRMG